MALPPSPAPSVSGAPQRQQHADLKDGYLITPCDTPVSPSLRDTLVADGRKRGDSSSTGSTSEEDYDKLTQSPDTLILRRRKPVGVRGEDGSKLGLETLRTSALAGANGGIPEGRTEDGEINGDLNRALLMAQSAAQNARPKFKDLVFTRQFSAFDRQNTSSANSPFHGFFTLFWMGVAIFVLQIGAENWRNTGNVLGTNEIMKGMSGDLVIMLAADGLMCGLMAVSWAIQLLVFYDYINWDKSGWILQNLWQTSFLAGVVGLPLLRPWPWTHVTFFVLHGITMLMKQHSYAFYNGHLSTAYKRRSHLFTKLKQLDNISPIPPLSHSKTSINPVEESAGSRQTSPPDNCRPSLPASCGTKDDIARVSNEIESGKPLDLDQIQLYELIIKYGINTLAEELRGKSTSPNREYPKNLTLKNAAEYVALPTVVYELEYPRSETINWAYVAEKGAATVGILVVMIMISQARMYPVIIKAMALKEQGMPLAARLETFPWLLLDLIMPFMMEYLLAWYLIWESVLNILAELTLFADRSFYDAWWNSVSWDQYARDWNKPVHKFLLRHVYHSSISSWKVGKHTATVITFLLSACVHELVMWCIFKKLRGYLLLIQMSQLPLVSLSRTRYLKGRQTLGNLVFWFGLFLGPSLVCSLYIIL